MSKLYDFFATGGVFMIPLVICSIVSLGIILERINALRRARIIKLSLARAITDMRYGDNTTLVEQLSADEKTVLARLVRSCLLYTPWSKAENVEVLQTKARKEISQMERGLVFLEICVGVGPLLGLLGTVSGLVTIFAQVGSTGDAASQGATIAQGIAEALHTTIAGLVVAIPAMIAYSIFLRQVDRYSVELESICQDLLGKLYTESSDTANASS